MSRAPLPRGRWLVVAFLLVAAFHGGRWYESARRGDTVEAALAELESAIGENRRDLQALEEPPPSPQAARRDRLDTRERLRRDIAALAPQRPGHPDLFVLGIAGDGTEQVFLNEVNHLRELAERRLDARGRVLVLANHDAQPPAPATVPASPATIRDALKGIGAAMDPAEDVLLLYATTHGSEDHWLLLRRPGWPDGSLDAKRLRRALDDAGIRHRVLVLSACFSGGLAPGLETPDTLVLTAARADRTSFGCGDDSVATFFGRAWLVDAMNTTVDFAEAFRRARAAIAMREAVGDYEASRPQIREGTRIGATLAAWRAAFAAGEPVPYRFAEPGFPDTPADGSGDAGDDAAEGPVGDAAEGDTSTSR